MSSARRPGSDEECDYPHPPPWVFQEAPLTTGQFLRAIWADLVPGTFAGAVHRGMVGLVIGLIVAMFSDGPLVGLFGTVAFSTLGWALAGGIILAMLLTGMTGLGLAIQGASELVAWPFRRLASRSFRSTVDPDADLPDLL